MCPVDRVSADPRTKESVMTVSTAVRPQSNEYAPYYDRYISLIAEPNALEALERQLAEMMPVLRSITEAQGDHRYAAGKWSIRQVIGHLIDAERVFAYRALRFSRGDRTPLPGFEENDYAETAGSERRSLRDLIDELELVRRSTLAMLRGLDDAAWTRIGTANDVEMSVRAIAFVIAGHGRHHTKLLQERYLSAK
jgi:uncharacterized damage-inducible protein DinB